ncbi:MAG: flagellar protein FliS [Acidimicrobiia bacterium]
MNASMIRNRSVGDSVTTASPGRLVTMLYDRLVRDLVAAEAALGTADLEGANNNLIHAQEVASVRSLVEPLADAWHQAAELSAGTNAFAAIPA